MRRAALAGTALAVVVAALLAATYARDAYAPAGEERVVAVWGRRADERPADGVEVVGIRPSVLRVLRAKAGEPVLDSAVRVYVEGGAPARRAQQVVGRYAVLRDRIRFEPRFPFAPGVAYRVEVETGRLNTLAGGPAGETERTRLTHRFSVPAARVDRTTRVAAVHPSVDRVPSNVLRWYIEFSAPMRPGSAYDYVQLVDEAGRPVANAFLRVDEELWDAERRRITLFFDPGRIKRGVRANVELGAPLVEGRRYRLVIDPAWPDARGAGLASGFEKEFDVGPADRESPDPSRWRVSGPAAGTRQALRVEFGEPLDHALIGRMLGVERGGRVLRGAGAAAAGDSAWVFTPVSLWESGSYALRLSVRLEDVAGNSVARVFDADRLDGAPPAEELERRGAWRSVGFRVR